jgi:ribonuclease P protein component
VSAAAGDPVLRLRRRGEFTAAAKGARWHAPTFTLQARRREGGNGHIGVGFTTTRRLGGAVVRNRIRRRLREAARQVLPGTGLAGVDYVLVAKPAALTCPFGQLISDLAAALPAIGRRLGRSPG